MPRPRKADSDKLSALIPAIRCHPAEREALAAQATAAGLSLSAYVRALAAEDTPIVAPEPLADVELIAELKRIGVNLNQIARVANATGELPARLADALIQHEALLETLIDGSLRR